MLESAVFADLEGEKYLVIENSVGTNGMILFTLKILMCALQTNGLRMFKVKPANGPFLWIILGLNDKSLTDY